VRRAFPARFPAAIDTMVYLHPGTKSTGRQVSLRSAAAFEVSRELEGPWKWASRLHWLPRPLTDLVYRLFGACRYRLFGKLDACRIPTPEQRDRLLP
jgi:predicted DCC family thiol-disulfide oxidoreductase YuxK